MYTCIFIYKSSQDNLLLHISSVINGDSAKSTHKAPEVYMGSDVTMYYSGSLFRNDSLLSIYQVCLGFCMWYLM